MIESTDTKNLGSKLHQLFDVLNTPEDERQSSLDEDLARFPYINGGLFKDNLAICSFTSKSRKNIIDAAHYDWKHVKPAIFGSMFEGIMNKDERREMGSHYTSTENVLKVIKPLFLDELTKEFDDIACSKTGNKRKKLKEFQEKLSKLRFLDPACGSGSFLITAYEELRKLEFDVIRLIYHNRTLSKSTVLSKVNVDQFYGIELGEFPARITETAMWMVDHLMNNQLEERYQGRHIRIPLEKQANIHRGDALKCEWKDVLKPRLCNYIMGNPPFIGAANMKPEQKEQTKGITGSSKLDYVSNWFVKAAEYIVLGTDIGFVSTNSITSGEQVPLLWPLLKSREIQIHFAYKSFLWGSDASKSASVTVVIIGLTKNKEISPVLYDQNSHTTCGHITPYLFASTNPLPIVVNNSAVRNTLPKLSRGSAVSDNSNYIFNEDEYMSVIKNDQTIQRSFFKQYMDGRSLLHGIRKYVLDIEDIPPIYRESEFIKDRMQAVRTFRLSLKPEHMIKAAKTPERFTKRVVPTECFMALSRVSSENREYLPIAILESNIVPSEAVNISIPVNLGVIGLLSSKMHMLWVKAVSGRLKNDIRYSNDTYRSFPIPSTNLDSLIKPMNHILRIRDDFKHLTLHKMYEQNTMPGALREAHAKLDHEVEKLYRNTGFKNDDERLEFLFKKYSSFVLDLITKQKEKKKFEQKNKPKSKKRIKRNTKKKKQDELQLVLF